MTKNNQKQTGFSERNMRCIIPLPVGYWHCFIANKPIATPVSPDEWDAGVPPFDGVQYRPFVARSLHWFASQSIGAHLRIAPNVVIIQTGRSVKRIHTKRKRRRLLAFGGPCQTID